MAFRKAGNHIERIHIQRVGVEVGDVVNDLVVEVDAGVDQRRLHQALTLVVVHVVVHPLLVFHPRELLLFVPKEILRNGLRGIVDPGDAAAGIVGEVRRRCINWIINTFVVPAVEVQ